jgi:ABC-type transport system involved in multi-copper enzyme maturation permease subunit
MIRNIINIALFTFSENIKKKNFIILAVYILAVIGAAILFGYLAPYHRTRVILDVGLAAVEMFIFLSCAFLSVRIILQEIEQKTVYLILSRPVSRMTYLAGRYLGVIYIMAVYVFFMMAALAIMLLLTGWDFGYYYIAIAATILFKAMIIAAFSILLSLISTSSSSSFISIFFIWVLGNFSKELKYIIGQIAADGHSFLALMLKFFYFILPNFAILNYKDFFNTKAVFNSDLLLVTVYTLLYSSALFLFSSHIFSRKQL